MIINNRITEALANALSQIKPFLEDDDILEIYLNPDGKLWIDRMSTGRNFTGIIISEQQARRACSLIASTVGVELTEKNPILQAEFPELGHRFQAEIPPIADSPTFNLRKKAIQVFTMDDYTAKQIITLEQRQIIEEAIRSKANIIISGATGSGKTTLLNCLLDLISKTGARVITIEDTNELQNNAEDKVALRSKPGVSSMHELLIASLRKRPDRIIIGELREGAAAMTALKSWCTGHPGGIASIHANSAKDALVRLEYMLKEVSVGDPSGLISLAVGLVIHIQKVISKIKVTQIMKVEPNQEIYEKYRFELIA